MLSLMTYSYAHTHLDVDGEQHEYFIILKPITKYQLPAWLSNIHMVSLVYIWTS